MSKVRYLDEESPCLLEALVSELPGMGGHGCQPALLAYATPILQFIEPDS